ncbi:unannotated protein [freshwater metagenome]|uniref:Unannotated protein n=1 Tax=freshwater metagenome TaxID=449393 RepID=A0A6J6TR62_9ZZZZ
MSARSTSARFLIGRSKLTTNGIPTPTVDPGAGLTTSPVKNFEGETVLNSFVDVVSTPRASIALASTR